MTVEGKVIPHAYLEYLGHENTYITYFNSDIDRTFTADNQLLGYILYYDFDVYSKSNYEKILEILIDTLENNGFSYCPSKNSPDYKERETGLYHKTLCFSIPYQRGENNG